MCGRECGLGNRQVPEEITELAAALPHNIIYTDSRNTFSGASEPPGKTSGALAIRMHFLTQQIERKFQLACNTLNACIDYTMRL
jgi:hypothetical protein